MTIEEQVNKLIFPGKKWFRPICPIGLIMGRKQRDQMNTDAGRYTLLDPCGDSYETIAFMFGVFTVITKEDFDGIEVIYGWPKMH